MSFFKKLCVGINELHLVFSSTHFILFFISCAFCFFHSPHLLYMPCLSIFFPVPFVCLALSIRNENALLFSSNRLHFLSAPLFWVSHGKVFFYSCLSLTKNLLFNFHEPRKKLFSTLSSVTCKIDYNHVEGVSHFLLSEVFFWSFCVRRDHNGDLFINQTRKENFQLLDNFLYQSDVMRRGKRMMMLPPSAYLNVYIAGRIERTVDHM